MSCGAIRAAAHLSIMLSKVVSAAPGAWAAAGCNVASEDLRSILVQMLSPGPHYYSFATNMRLT